MFMYKAIILDLDDTLYEYEALNRQAVAALRDYTCQLCNVSAEEFDSAFSKARKDTKDILGETGASHNRMLYCQRTLENLGKKPTVAALGMYELYWGYMLEHMVLRDGVKEMLDLCRDRGMKVGICSDLTAHIQHRKLKTLGIDEYIDAIVTSEEAGAEKPNPIMFHMILNKLGVDARDAIFIGDSLRKDIEGAASQGIEPLWFHNGEHKSFRTISSFYEIRGILDGIK